MFAAINRGQTPVSQTVRARSNAAWIAAAAGLAGMIVLFYPGFMSPDSADQWMQARTGRYTSTHPALMALLWSVTDRIVPGPGGLFIVHATLFWFALGWLSRELFARPLAQIACVVLIGCWPPIFGTVAHLWKDVPMLAFALLALAALARDQRVAHRRWLLLALIAFAAACAYRHNALPLVLPFVFFLITPAAGARRLGARLAITAGLGVILAAVSTLPNRHPAVIERDVWPVTAIWDIAAVSIARDRMLVPPDWRTDDLTVEELRAAFQPWSNTTIFDTDKLRISIYSDLTPEQRGSLRRAWLELWTRYPADIVRHRLRLTGLLFGWRSSTLPASLKIWLKMSALPGDPPVQMRPSPLRERAIAGLYAAAQTPLFTGWFYLLMLAAVAVSALRARQHALFWPTVTSVALFCLPLVLFAPSAEFRYLLWPVVASLTVIALRFARPADNVISGTSMRTSAA